jgi:hypothetical protein
MAWMRNEKRLYVPLVGEYALAGGSSQLGLLSVAFFSSLTALGQVKAAQTLVGPLYVLFQGFSSYSLPEMRRVASRSIPMLKRIVTASILMLGITSAIYSSLLLLVPQNAGKALLGNAWVNVQPLLIPLAIFVCSEAVIVGCRLSLRALQQVSVSFRARAITVPMTLAATAVGAAVSGAAGALWGLGLADVIAATWWIISVQRMWPARSEPLHRAGRAKELAIVSD